MASLIGMTDMLVAALQATGGGPAGGGGEEAVVYRLLNEQLLLLATVVGAIAALPSLIEFIVEYRKRRERMALSLDDEQVSGLTVRLAGMDGFLAANADLIDRARFPEAYRDVAAGNEMLLIGPPLSGKKTVARRMAQLAGMDRLITVHNPRNSDALARAKALLRRAKHEKVMLLLPNIDEVFDDDDGEAEAELDALIEATAARENILVVATANACPPGSALDNLFGVVLALPGTQVAARAVPEVNAIGQGRERAAVLREVALFYLARAEAGGARLVGMDAAAAAERLVAVASNPAEVEDVVAVARTAATWSERQRTGAGAGAGARAGASGGGTGSGGGGAVAEITPAVLEKAIARVLPGTVPVDWGHGTRTAES
ncbi:MAG: AAA family ATPase [bacterium]